MNRLQLIFHLCIFNVFIVHRINAQNTIPISPNPSEHLACPLTPQIYFCRPFSSCTAVVPSINLKPSPVSSMLTVECGSDDCFIHAVEVFDMTGKSMFSNKYFDATVSVNLEHLPAGYYMAMVNYGLGISMRRIVVL